MTTYNYVVAYITASNGEEAEKISRALVGEKLVACVNTVPAVCSRYWWQGKIESADEVFLIAKTKGSLMDKIMERVKKLHSYAVPEVIFLPIIGGNSDYLQWIDESVSAG